MGCSNTFWFAWANIGAERNNLAVCMRACVGVCACVTIMSQWWCGTRGPQFPSSRLLPRTPGSEGAPDGGISCWEETAEACVASALANQHSVHHRASTYSRYHASLFPPLNNPPPQFFCSPLSTGVRHPQKAWAHKSQKGQSGEERRGQRPTEVLGQSCLCCWVITDTGLNWEFFKLDRVLILFWKAKYRGQTLNKKQKYIYCCFWRTIINVHAFSEIIHTVCSNPWPAFPNKIN